MKIISFLSLILIFISCSNKSDIILPEQRALTESVYSSVTIQPDSLYEVYAIVAGIIDDNFVEENDNVSKDQALIQIINNTPKLNTQNAKFSLELAQENYNGSAAILSSLKDDVEIDFIQTENLIEVTLPELGSYDVLLVEYQ